MFSLNPDGGPPRIIRFVAAGELPGGVLAELDKKNNVLRISEPLYLQLTEIEREQLLRTHARITELLAA